MPAVGDLLADRYRIDGVLGAGGMATVYAATDLRLERQVAVKVLLPNLARDASLAERFDREARILASVAHPNVADIFDVEGGDPDAGREPFYVMELCGGGSLAGRIESAGPLEPGELVPIIVSIAAAIGELHRRGLIHRDVKPANILFTGGRPKLADFGLAKPGGGLGLDMLTAPGTAIGTPAYMAPELVSGGDATTASDLYALAATTFHGLTGRAPRQADSLTTLAAAAAAALPRISELSPRLSGAFDEVVAAGLAEDPSDRPSLNTFTAGLVAALDRSSALGAPASVMPAPVTPAPVTPAVPDPVADETTRIEVPQPTRVPTGMPPRRASRESPGARRRQRTGAALPVGTAVFALAFVALGVLALSGLSSLFQPAGTTGGATPSSPLAVSPSPTAMLPSPSPSPSVRPSPTADPAGPALDALGIVLNRIDAARGGHDGLKGSEANDLDNLALEVGRRLHAGDYAGARQVALDLQDRAQRLTEHVDKQHRDALLSAIQDLLSAIPN